MRTFFTGVGADEVAESVGTPVGAPLPYGAISSGLPWGSILLVGMELPF